MTSYILNTTAIQPLSKNKPQQVIVLCHGYGGDGKDISMLTYNWKSICCRPKFWKYN